MRFGQALLAGAALTLVGDQDHLVFALAQPAGEALVHRQDARAGIDQEQHDVGAFDGTLGEAAHARLQPRAAGGFPARRIEQGEGEVAQLGRPLAHVARHARCVVDDRAAAADPTVEQGRFADIGPPDVPAIRRRSPASTGPDHSTGLRRFSSAYCVSGVTHLILPLSRLTAAMSALLVVTKAKRPATHGVVLPPMPRSHRRWPLLSSTAASWPAVPIASTTPRSITGRPRMSLRLPKARTSPREPIIDSFHTGRPLSRRRPTSSPDENGATTKSPEPDGLLPPT